MRQWLMLQDYIALNTTFKKKANKPFTLRTTTRKEKQLDCVMIDKSS